MSRPRSPDTGVSLVGGQSQLDHRDNRAWALANLGRALAYALATYKDFLTLWKDAHPDIPILKQAKAEYAKLQ
jgi:eukaryotic-like serine/threonine-protein kinase